MAEEINVYSDITPEIEELAQMISKTDYIDPELFTRFDVKRGLRDLNGKGVLTGLTRISEILATKEVDGETVPADGRLYYRGYNVEDIIKGLAEEDRFGFEEVTYLLLFGALPTKKQLKAFTKQLFFYRSLPTSFVRDIIMKAPSRDMMNTLSRSTFGSDTSSALSS